MCEGGDDVALEAFAGEPLAPFGFDRGYLLDGRRAACRPVGMGHNSELSRTQGRRWQSGALAPWDARDPFLESDEVHIQNLKSPYPLVRR